MYKLHIVPGWAEGNWHFRQFKRGLSDRFQLESNADFADIIIAHSSNCYSLPDTKNKQLVVILNPQFWAGKNIFHRIKRHLILDAPEQISTYGLDFRIRLRFWNLLYIAIEPWRYIKIWRSLVETFQLAKAAKVAPVLKDSNDAYYGPQIIAVAEHRKIKFLPAERLREDCWFNPQPYINILLSELKFKLW